MESGEEIRVVGGRWVEDGWKMGGRWVEDGWWGSEREDAGRMDRVVED